MQMQTFHLNACTNVTFLLTIAFNDSHFLFFFEHCVFLTAEFWEKKMSLQLTECKKSLPLMHSETVLGICMQNSVLISLTQLDSSFAPSTNFSPTIFHCSAIAQHCHFSSKTIVLMWLLIAKSFLFFSCLFVNFFFNCWLTLIDFVKKHCLHTQQVVLLVVNTVPLFSACSW